MNKEIIDEFNALAKQIKAEYLNAQIEHDIKEMTMHEFRLRTVKKILGILKKIDFEITSSADLKDIPGIGKGTNRRIDEILKTGHLSEIEQKYSAEKQKKITGIQELTKVIGIGDAFAKLLVTEYKITDINKLKAAHAKGKIQLSKNILLGLKYYGVSQGNIPRKEITQVEKFLIKTAHDIDPDLKVIICGSYRRGTKTSGDIDVLLYHPAIKVSKQFKHPSYLELFVDTLYDQGFIKDHLTDKNYKMKYMGFCKYKTNLVRRIDIRLIPYNSLYTAMLYFTGPMELNMAMRQRAKKRGMMLNEYGLYTETIDEGKKQIKINSEADVFKKLDMKYLTPSEREKYNAGKGI